MKPPLDLSAWPLDGNQWIAKTAEALKAAGVDADAVARFTRAMHGARGFDLVCQGCVTVLERHYEVKA